MARSRNIKPGLFQNDELAELEPIDRLFFIGLWTICDYKGCLEYRPKKIKAQILPYDNADVEEIAINLDKSGFVSIYSNADKKYLKVLNFSKHQNPHKNERDAGSTIPDIDSEGSTGCENKGLQEKPDKIGTNPDCDGSDPADSLLLIPDSLNPIKTLDQSSIDHLFDMFWKSGIRKLNKKKSQSLFSNLLKKESDPENFTMSLCEDVTRRLNSNQLGFAQMHPTTYLNGERWNDEVITNDQENRPNGNTAPNRQTPAQRTRAAAERWEAEQKGHVQALGGDAGGIRPPVEQPIRGGTDGDMGAIIDGDFSRTD